MKHSSIWRLILVLGCMAAFLAGCSRDPNVRKQKYFESGDRYFNKAKYREAIIEYRNATEVDPTFADAHYKLAQSYVKLQDWQRAFTELNRTVELQPDNYKARIDMANLLVLDGQPDHLKAAQDQVDVLLDKQPNEADTHIAAASVLGRQQRVNQALAEIQKAIALAPTRGDAYYDQAVLQSQANLPDAAEASYKKAIELNATGVNPRLALAGFYQAHNRYAEAEQQIRQVMDSDPKDVNSRIGLARLYMSQGRRADAENFLAQVKQQFPNNSLGYRMLGDFYFAIRDLDKALAEYASLYHDHGNDLQVQKNYTQLLILKNRIDEASKLNDDVLKSHPKDEEALTYRGEIQLAQGKAADAVRTLQSVVTSNPDMATAHYQLGLALNQTGDMDHAGGEWREAVRIRPDMVEAQRMLALYSMQKGDMSSLEAIAGKMISLQPASPDGYAIRAVALMAQKQFPGAEQDARKAIQIAPQSAAGYLQMANLMALQQKFPQAESWYKQALSHDKNSIDSLRGLLNVYLAQKQTEKAISAAQQQISLVPDNSGFYGLLGSVEASKPDLAAATAAYKKAVDLNKNNADAYLKLAQVQYKSGGLDDALATCNAGAQNSPKDPAFYMMMGSVYEKKNDLGNARSSYEKALQLKPDDPLASNNLAYVLLETNSNPDLALRLAQTARRGLPELSNVADTLGWAFYQKGIYQSAIRMFQEAIKLASKHKEPESATYHYHLGLAYAKAEQPVLAKEHLERVLKLDPKYSDADDVRKQLAQLKS
jgi:tetratricopeptide (TPR) repeat protein